MGSRSLLAASILAADFAELGEAIREAEAGGADWIHIDVMDGHFVPNLTMGPVVVEACRRVTRIPLDVHLMVETPERFVAPFIEAGADRVSVHVEAAADLVATLRDIQARGARAGVALNPETAPEAVRNAMGIADLVLVMSVHPGYAGQAFLHPVLEKLPILSGWRAAGSGRPVFEIDGGINPETARQAAAAGAEVFVAASAVFGHPRGIRAGLAELRSALEPAPA